MLAESLPVRSVPEQLGITTMRYDVVNNCRLRIPTFFQALLAERLHIPEKCFTRLTPSCCVAAAGSGPHLLGVECFVAITVLGSGWHEFRTARMLAGCIWPIGHGVLLLDMKRPSSDQLLDLLHIVPIMYRDS